MIRAFLLSWVLLTGVSTPAVQAQEADFPVYYFDSQALSYAGAHDPANAGGRVLLPSSEREWISPVLIHFPKAVQAEGKLFYRSDDDCTYSPNRMFGVEIWRACRKHDYCLAELADYVKGEDFRAAYHRCNLEFKANIQSLCEPRHRSLVCNGVESLYYLGVSALPVTFRTYVSTQHKQALFLAEVLRTHAPEVEKFLDIDATKRQLAAFCEKSAVYRSQRDPNRKWEMYSDSKNDDLPYSTFQPCEVGVDGLMPKALPR